MHSCVSLSSPELVNLKRSDFEARYATNTDNCVHESVDHGLDKGSITATVQDLAECGRTIKVGWDSGSIIRPPSSIILFSSSEVLGLQDTANSPERALGWFQRSAIALSN